MCNRRSRGGFFAPSPPPLPPIPRHPWAALKRPILSRVKARNFIKKRLQRRCFPVNAPKSLRTPILNKICERLLLSRMWQCCWKYVCEWPKRDLAAEEAASKFLKTFMNILWISILTNTAIALTCSKFKKYFRFSHLFVTLLFIRISLLKSKHIKDKVILLSNILINYQLVRSWFYNKVDFGLVKSAKTLMKREITIISFVFVLEMQYLLNSEFVFFFKFVFRLLSLFLIHPDIIQ